MNEKKTFCGSGSGSISATDQEVFFVAKKVPRIISPRAMKNDGPGTFENRMRESPVLTKGAMA